MSSEKLELFVSLGHNASAVLAKDGVVIRGFEQERIDRRKSSSAYPHEAIREAMGSYIGVDQIYVSHWFDRFDLHTNKYIDLEDLKGLSSNIRGVYEDLTHHDAHARSAVGFARTNGVTGNQRVLVIDGFGNQQECLSVYDYRSEEHLRRASPMKLVHRTYGYKMSLGLMYQYATEYLSLKPNQDEYKLLGYEADILKYVSLAEAADIIRDIGHEADAHAIRMMSSTLYPNLSDSLINYEDLADARTYWLKIVDKWRSRFDPMMNLTGVRTCVAFCAQTFLELSVMSLIKLLPAPPDGATMVMAGGSFYNVKLSRFIAKSTYMSCFTHPLAGDQGAAIGMAGRVPEMAHLYLGSRDYSNVAGSGVFCLSKDAWIGFAGECIDRGAIVNVVRGDMEFGPRALCHTTTFALPTKRNVRRINALNDRDEAMPMAPVMTRAAADMLLNSHELYSIKGNDKFMITTVAFNEEPGDDLMGVAHKDPLSDIWTARPQITDEPEMVGLLTGTKHETLINTSFNYHGEPIVNTIDDAVRTHNMQKFRARTCGIDDPVTIIVAP